MKRISRMARDRGILVCVDGAQCLGWMKVDLQELDCDFYANSPHKWLFTPIGTGFLYVKKEMVPRLKASIISSGWDTLETAKKFETFGTRNLPEAIAMGEGVDLVNAIGIERVEERDYRLAAKLRDGLIRIPGVTMLSADSTALASPLTSILLNRADGTKLDPVAVRGAYLNKYRIQVRHVGEAGLGAIRLSTHIYNSPACIDKVLHATEEIARKGV
jgi:selenocysteine lyase/cysteine desulfurase